MSPTKEELIAGGASGTEADILLRLEAEQQKAAEAQRQAEAAKPSPPPPSESPGDRAERLNEDYKQAQARGDTETMLALKAQIAVAQEYNAASEPLTGGSRGFYES